MLKIGLSSMGFELTDKNFENLKKSGIAGIEISMSEELYKDIDYKNLKELSKRHEIELWSYHLPFCPFTKTDISAIDKTIKTNTIAYFSELIKKASDIGIDKFIVHPSGEPIDDKDRAEKMKISMDSLNELAEIAASNGAVIAVEDLPRTCLGKNSDEILKLTEANDKLRVCFDTNHLLGEDNLDFLDRVGKKIITVHVSDYDFVNERHWLPGEGKTDWKAMYSKFEEIGYSGMWLYEIALKCPKTIIRDRDLTFDDFYNNAVNIFSGKELKAIGRQKENLGFWE